MYSCLPTCVHIIGLFVFLFIDLSTYHHTPIFLQERSFNWRKHFAYDDDSYFRGDISNDASGDGGDGSDDDDDGGGVGDLPTQNRPCQPPSSKLSTLQRPKP